MRRIPSWFGVAFVIVGCSSSSAGGGGSGGSGGTCSPTAPHACSGSCDPCSILTTAQVSAVVGQTVTAGPDPSDVVRAPLGQFIDGVWAAGPNDAWVAGAAGTTMHWDGNTLSPSPGDTWPVMIGVGGSKSGGLWAVGGDGAILHHS